MRPPKLPAAPKRTRKYVSSASGCIAFPEHVSVTVEPDEKLGLYRLHYRESIRTKDKALIARTVETCKKLLRGQGEVRDYTGLPHDPSADAWHSFELLMTTSHEEIGSVLSFEFLGWSPLGKRSITEIIMRLVGAI